jgi:hypothetical protein
MSLQPTAVSQPVPAVTPRNSAEFGRTAVAILVTMVLLIVALTGILVETTWHNPTAAAEVLQSDPGSFARR